jgi:hypothetical protein
MMTRDAVAAWARRTHNVADADELVQEGPHALLIHLAPPGNYGGATAVVSRRTGEYWLVGSNVNFLGLRDSVSEEDLRAVLATCADVDRPEGVLAPPVTREQVAAWLGERSGWRHLDGRITDLGWLFLVNTQPDDFLDGTGPQDPAAGPIVVVKGGGAVWFLPPTPNLTRAIGAPDSRTFRAEMTNAGHPLPADPNEWLTVPAQLPREDGELTSQGVARWLAGQYGWRHIDDRIHDLGWGFSVDTQPDEYHDGDRSAMTWGNGPIMIVKRTGAAWSLSSRPEMVEVMSARDERRFYKLMRAAEPFFDKDRPSAGWVRP